MNTRTLDAHAANKDNEVTRRRFIAYFSGTGLGASLLPGVLWGQMQTASAQRIDAQMLKGALAVAGIEYSEEDQAKLLKGVNKSLERFEKIRKIGIPNEVEPPIYFSALVPGMNVNKESQPFRMSAPEVRRPAALEEVAFWPLTDLAQLVKKRGVTSVALTELYLRRLKKFGRSDVLNCVVTLLEDRALEQARRADAEIAAGRYRGPLHGIPWGVKDLFAVKGYKTTWGSAIFKDQVIDHDASVVEMLDRAGAVLIAKLSTAELAAGDDYWFGGRTRNPWDLTKGAGGSSSGSAAATAAGLVGFALGTETNGSIIWPSSRCGVTGLRPTYGRISRYGAMPLGWTIDRPGPLCRYAEDCALVMKEIARVDGRDMSVADVPFNWNAGRDVRTLKVGYLKDAFDEITDADARRRNAQLLGQIRALGVKPVPVTVPDFMVDGAAVGVESAAFFEELIRTGRDIGIRDKRRVHGIRAMRLIPAVEYLQSQRVRMMLMMKLAEATRGLDVYFAPITVDFPDPPPEDEGNKAANDDKAAKTPDDKPAQPKPQEPESIARRHASMANLATYPALAVPCGFTADGLPQSVTMFARPFGESELLTFGKAYQDATRYYLQHPRLAGDSV